MRINEIRLSWFRGASEHASLKPATRSVVVFGANGAGKSCFVDAVEYTLRGGRIEHLAHEYSGRHQEKAVLNTHRPDDEPAFLALTFGDKSSVRTDISPNGSTAVSTTGDPSQFLGLDCQRTVLRQDEVSAFIHSTKGEKYSVLLPLLGLGGLETTAENFRQLARALRKSSGVDEAISARKAAETALRKLLPDGDLDADSVVQTICAAFVQDPTHTHSAGLCAEVASSELKRRLEDSSALERRQAALERLGTIDLRASVSAVRTAAAQLAAAADKSTRERLKTLRTTANFLTGAASRDQVECPACGRAISRDRLLQHVEAELAALQGTEEHVQSYRDSVASFRSRAAEVRAAVQSADLEGWAKESDKPVIGESLEVAKGYSLPSGSIEEADLAEAEGALLGAIVNAAAAASFLPPPAADIAEAGRRLDAAVKLREAEGRVEETSQAELLVQRVEEVEVEVREEIRSKSAKVIEEISTDIQRFWGILHPGEPIEDVRLHVPDDATKAIDVTLKFYGKELESPRLTLSEGYRNSLGLCVFLSMAAKYGDCEAPIILDDVIVSLDRGHRGMVSELLQREFADRQVLLFTHDRDWFTDLRQEMSGGQWRFAELLPYGGPSMGIRWAGRTNSLTDAREFLDTRPDTAANEARKVMDVELAIYCEKLSIQLKFVRGARNDRRTSYEFLGGLLKSARENFQLKIEPKYVSHDEGIKALEAAQIHLATWGNRGSHGPDVTRPEAEKLIGLCEKVLEVLTCVDCKKPVYRFEDQQNGTYQCQCGTLRWK